MATKASPIQKNVMQDSDDGTVMKIYGDIGCCPAPTRLNENGYRLILLREALTWCMGQYPGKKNVAGQTKFETSRVWELLSIASFLLASSMRRRERLAVSGNERRAIEKRVSPALLDAIARRYRAALNQFFEKRIVNLGVESEDLSQEVFIRLANRAEKDDISNVEGYIFQTASSVLMDRARRRAVRKEVAHVQFDEVLHAETDFSPERLYSGRQEIAAVIAAIGELPERTREIFVLHRFEGETQIEIARRMGISVSWVEKHITRAVAFLIDRTRSEQ